jgi:hypothetical protein
MNRVAPACRWSESSSLDRLDGNRIGTIPSEMSALWLGLRRVKGSGVRTGTPSR